MIEIDQLLKEIDQENLSIYSTAQVIEMLSNLDLSIKQKEQLEEMKKLQEIKLAYDTYLKEGRLNTKTLSSANKKLIN